MTYFFLFNLDGVSTEQRLQVPRFPMGKMRLKPLFALVFLAGCMFQASLQILQECPDGMSLTQSSDHNLDCQSQQQQLCKAPMFKCLDRGMDRPCCIKDDVCSGDQMWPTGHVKVYKCDANTDCTNTPDLRDIADVTCNPSLKVCCARKPAVASGVCPSGNSMTGQCKIQGNSATCEAQTNLCYHTLDSASSICCPPFSCSLNMLGGKPVDENAPRLQAQTYIFKESQPCEPSQYLEKEELKGKAVCCPRPTSYTLSKAVGNGTITWETISAVGFTDAAPKKAKTCKKNEDCAQDEFCDASHNIFHGHGIKALDRSAPNNEPYLFCFKLPKMLGVPFKPPGTDGLLACNTHADCKNQSLFCAKSSTEFLRRGSEKPYSGICITAKCAYNNQQNGTGYVTDRNTECSRAEQCANTGPMYNIPDEDKDYYQRECVNVTAPVGNIFPNLPSARFCCFDKLPKDVCDLKGRPKLDEAGRAQMKCSNSKDCAPNEVDGYCVKGLCCRGSDRCPDGFTKHYFEKECAKDGDCGSFGVCESQSKHCCPRLNATNAENQPQPGPYCTKMKCVAWDFMPLGAYCDAAGNVCYLGATNKYKEKHTSNNKECTKNTECDKNFFCVRASKDINRCYYDPFVKKTKEVNGLYRILLIVSIIGMFLFAFLAVCSYMEYRSRSIFDKYKKRKAKKSKKDTSTTSKSSTMSSVNSKKGKKKKKKGK